VARRGDHVTQGHHYRSAGATPPFWRRGGDVDPGRPKSVALFLAGGTIGWSSVGAVLAFAPGGWVAPVLAAAFICVGTQYIAWWRLGASIFLLCPLPLRLMGRIIGLPDMLSIVVVYASMAWVVVSLLLRHSRGVAPSAHGRHWVQVFGLALVLIGALPMMVWAFRERFGSSREWVGSGARARRSRIINRAPLLRWAGQSLVTLGTLGVFVILFARLG
jgi:hypothetical protein